MPNGPRDAQSIAMEKDIISVMTAAVHGDDPTVMSILMEHEPVELVQPLLGVGLAFLNLAARMHPGGIEGFLHDWGQRILHYEVMNDTE